MFCTSRLSTVSLGLETDFGEGFAFDFAAVFDMPYIVLISAACCDVENTSHIRNRKWGDNVQKFG